MFKILKNLERKEKKIEDENLKIENRKYSSFGLNFLNVGLSMI